VLSASVAEHGTDFVVTDGCGAQGKNWDVERAFADAMEKVDGLPDGFRFHDYADVGITTTFGTISRRCSSPEDVT
jgi:hypothetical protein